MEPVEIDKSKKQNKKFRILTRVHYPVLKPPQHHETRASKTPTRNPMSHRLQPQNKGGGNPGTQKHA